MLNDDIKVGDTLLYGTRYSENLSPAIVKKIGRTLLHVEISQWWGLSRFNRSDLHPAPGERHAYGNLYRRAEDHAAAFAAEKEDQAANTAWRNLKCAMPFGRPDHLTASQINEITSLIKGNGTDD